MVDKKKRTKTTTNSTSKKKATTKKITTPKIKAIKERQTRAEILQTISEMTNLKRVEVEAVFSSFSDIVKGHMKKRGSGEIMIPKIGLKIRRVRRKATKTRTMISPLTGKEVVIPAKPKRDDVKLIALKALKETVAE